MANTIYDVFISHSGKDKEVADAICYELERNNIKCWIAPRNILPGEDWAPAIMRGIRESRVMVLVYSKNSNQSDNVLKEVDRAFNNKKTIIPFVVDDTPPCDAFDYYLAGKHWFVAYPHYAEKLLDLTKVVAKVLEVELKPQNASQSVGSKLASSDMTTSVGRVANEAKPQKELPHLKIKSDLDCIFYIDGEERARLKAGVLQRIPLMKGEYELKFVSAENEADSLEMEFEMPEADKLEKLNLSAVRDERLKKEAIAKRAAEEKRIEEQRKAEEAKRLAEEKRKAEEARLAEERRKAEERRLAEQKRKEEEKRREEEAKRLAEEKRKEEERRLAEQKRKEEEEERQREEEARMSIRTFTVGGVSFKMIPVIGGSFWMGADNVDSNVRNYDPDASVDERPVHNVTLDTFYIGETEVTQALWKAVMRSNPSHFKGHNNPVENVSWNDCQDFIKKLNAKTGLTFRLPTEAEWEYAARGGYKSKGYKYAGSNTLDEVAWFYGNSGSKTHPVKTKSPNELGLYDMSGNVWEWCQDWFGHYSSNSQTNPTGPSSGIAPVLRGGSWGSNTRYCRATYRKGDSPGDRYSSRGFRLALVHP